MTRLGTREPLRFYTLTIKGEPMHADAALSEHGLGGDLTAELPGNVVVRVAHRDDLARTLNAWTAESPLFTGIGEPRRLPLGALLLWRELSRDELERSDRLDRRLANQLACEEGMRLP